MKKLVLTLVGMVIISSSLVLGVAAATTQDIGYYERSMAGGTNITYDTTRTKNGRGTYGINNNEYITSSASNKNPMITTRFYTGTGNTIATSSYTVRNGQRIKVYYLSGYGSDGAKYRLYNANNTTYSETVKGSWCPNDR